MKQKRNSRAKILILCSALFSIPAFYLMEANAKGDTGFNKVGKFLSKKTKQPKKKNQSFQPGDASLAMPEELKW